MNHMYPPIVRILLAAFALALGGPAVAVAAAAPNEDQPKSSSEVTVVEQALERPISLHFDKRPLNEVVRELDRRLPIRVALDRAALERIGLPLDMTVTLDVKDVSLGAALEIVFQLTTNLGWYERNDTLIITTAERAHTDEAIRYYDVTELIAGSGVNSDFDTLSTLIYCLIAPGSWPEGTGPGPIEPVIVGNKQLLAIPQMGPVHREIRLFLNALRQAKHHEEDADKSLFPEPKPIRYPDHAARLALTRQVQLGFPDMPEDEYAVAKPLNKVFLRLARAAKANIVIDEGPLRCDGIEPTTSIRVQPMHGTLRECLDKLCGPAGVLTGRLRWTVAHEVVWITTPDKEEMMTPTRLYDVRDMPYRPTRPVVTRAGNWVIDHRLPHEREQLTATLAMTIAPETWNNSAGVNRYEGSGISVLIVSQRLAVHRQIEAFLAALRQAQREGAAKAAGRQE